MQGWVISKQARLERVSRKMIRAIAGWLHRLLHRNNFTCRRRSTIAQQDAREFTEKLEKL